MPAGDIKEAFAASGALDITLDGLSSSATAARESAPIDNTSNLYLDALVGGQIATSGVPANDKAIYVYAYGSVDGVRYTDNAAGTGNAPLTMRDPTNLRLIGVVSTPDTGAILHQIGPFTVAPAFGGILPPKWGVVVRNFMGWSLPTGSGSNITWRGVYNTVASG